MDDQRAVRQARAFERFWDDLMSGRRGRPGNELDPDVIEAARRLQALSRPPSTDATFEANLWEDLMNAHTFDAGIPFQPRLLPHPNGHRHPLRHPIPPAGVGRVHRPDRRHFVQLAAAALLLLALGGWLLAEVIAPPGSDDGRHAIIPAAVAPDATPAAAVEFLWQTSGDPADPMENATNLAIAPDGAVWVPDGRNARFQIFSPEGELLEVWGSEGTGEGQFDFLLGANRFGGYGKSAIAFAPDGSFYVADTGNYRIQKFGPDRAFVTAWGSEGTGDGQFAGTADLAVDGQGRVYVLDAYRGFESSAADAVQVFDANGRFLASWGTQGSEPGQLMHAVGITVDRDGTILIADYQNNRVQRFSPEGEYLNGWGELGVGEGQISGPLDVAVDAQGHVFEVDYANNRVQVFDREGRFLVAWGRYGTEDGEFYEPVNVAVDDEGNAYVTEVSGRVQKFHIGQLPEPAAPPAASPVG